MIKTEPTLIDYLEKNALWIIMHPLQTFDAEIHSIYPWLRAETINFSRRINYHLNEVKYKVICAPSAPVGCFKEYTNITKNNQLQEFMTKKKLDTIVYCGFHYGACIVYEDEVGMKIMSKKYKCYVKQDLCVLNWENTWSMTDQTTSCYGTII